MPVHVKKVGKYYYVVEKAGSIKGLAKRGRKQTSKTKAIKQTQAINLSLLRRGKIKRKKK